MEHAQRDMVENEGIICNRVLILILMEHAQRDYSYFSSLHNMLS